jgi:hypothetical protein
MTTKILSVNTDAKTSKGTSKGYLTGIIYLAPHTIAGIGNVCSHASEACKLACLYSAGRGVYNSVQSARINRTRMLFNDKLNFGLKLEKEIMALIKKANKNKLIPCIRLNGTSDIAWNKIRFEFKSGMKQTLMERFSNVQFYDYTKNDNRFNETLPSNYRLTFSRSESNEQKAIELLNKGVNIAIVFRKQLPEKWKGFSVFNGDESDLRFLDPKNHVIGLKAKGKAKKDISGFVVD